MLRSNVRYPRPRSRSTASRATRSCAIRWATIAFSGCSFAALAGFRAVPFAVPLKSADNRTSGSLDMSAMSSPANFTASDSGRSRLPPQTGQAAPSMYRDTRRLISALWVLAKVCSTYRRALVKVPW